MTHSQDERDKDLLYPIKAPHKVKFSMHDEYILACTNVDKQLSIVDIRDSKPTTVTTSETSTAIAWSNDGSKLVVTGKEVVSTFDVRNMEKPKKFSVGKETVGDIAFSVNDDLFFMATVMGTVYVLAGDTLKPSNRGTFQAHTDFCTKITVDRTGK